MPNRSGNTPWLAWPPSLTALGLATVVVATSLALVLQQLYAAGTVGVTTAFNVSVALAIAHFAVILVVVLRTRSRIWASYLVLSVIGFVSLSAVTPISAVLLILRLSLGS